MHTRTVLFALVMLGLAAVCLHAQSQPQPVHRRANPADAAPAPTRPAVSREGIEALEAQLDRAVDRVSVPRPAALLGRAAARGYRLPGYGVVFVLSPRALPGEGLEVRPRHRVELRRVRPLPAPGAAGDEPPEVESLEQQVLVLQQETEQARRAAEEDMDRIVQDVRVRLAPEPLEVPAPAPAEAPQAATPAVAPAPPAPPAAIGPVTPPPEAPLPPAPPWKFWFEPPMAGDSRTPEAVIADVREALVQALEGAGTRVPGLRPEEFVTVAVDFERGGLLAQHARPARTLVIRARVRDCEAGARGALAKDELRRRVEVIEY